MIIKILIQIIRFSYATDLLIRKTIFFLNEFESQ